MTREFLLEIGTEEIPAGFIAPALKALEELIHNGLENCHIGHGEIATCATPRRLILTASEVENSEAVREVERTGPPKQAAFDKDGNPTQAAIGFARSQGVDVKDLLIVETKKGEQVAVRKQEGGRATIDVLAEILPGIFEKIPFPKTMRWMDLEATFARPVHWIVALFGGKRVPFQFSGIESGTKSFGHRFTHPKAFSVKSFDDLCSKLESQGVTLDPATRRKKIQDGISDLVTKQGLTVFEDAELLEEVTNLVESPYPLMGSFAEDFLELPTPILTTCMKKHQRYFSVLDGEGTITNRFIAVNNTPVRDSEVSIKGHERVLKARLEDARFYFKEDRKTPLIDHLQDLKGVVFHSRLGTSYEKVQRVSHLAQYLARHLVPEKLEEMEKAALLAKCDLETGIVYEFPELQGIIGSYYARLDGHPDEIADAIREHYLPAHAGDDLPKGIIGALVSVADRMDTIAGCFSVGLIPTGAADPYALRRHALGIIQIVTNLGQPLDLNALVREAVGLIGEKRTREAQDIEQEIMEFVRTRFVNFQVLQDYPLDVVEAAARARFDDLVDTRNRVAALSEWKRREDFDAIMIGFKRVVNILKDTAPSEMSEDLLQEKEEKDLYHALVKVRESAQPHIDGGDYSKALEIIADLKGPIDKLFDEVMVMVDDERLRANRLGLLREIAALFARIADFSFIGSTAE